MSRASQVTRAQGPLPFHAKRRSELLAGCTTLVLAYATPDLALLASEASVSPPDDPQTRVFSPPDVLAPSATIFVIP